MALTREKVEEATEILKRTVQDLRLQGVRNFKGKILGPDSQPLWDIEVSFERTDTKPRRGDE